MQERRPGFLQGVVLLLPPVLAVMAIIALAPVLPQLQVAFAESPGSKWLVPLVLTLPAICLIIFAPIAGWLGDRFGRRTLLIASMVVYSAAGLAPLLLDDLIAILCSRVGVGITEAFALTLSTTLVGDYFSDRERDKWLGYQTGMAAISAVFLVVIGGALGRYGWRAPFAVYALPLLFAVLVWLFTWEPQRQQPQQAQGAATQVPWRILAPICLVTLFAGVSFYVAQVENGVVLEVVGVHDAGQRGVLQALATLGTITGTIAFRFISTWPVMRLLAIGFACLGAGYWGIGQADTGNTVTAAMTLAQFGCGILLPTLLTWAMRNLSFEVRARGTGVWQGVFMFGQFICAPLFTAAVDQTGGILPAFSLFGVLSMAATALALAAMWLRLAPSGPPSKSS